MSNLVAIAYDDLDTAQQVVANISRGQAAHEIELDDLVIVERRGDGKIKLHQPSMAGAGAAGGALWGRHRARPPRHDGQGPGQHPDQGHDHPDLARQRGGGPARRGARRRGPEDHLSLTTLAVTPPQEGGRGRANHPERVMESGAPDAMIRR